MAADSKSLNDARAVSESTEPRHEHECRTATIQTCISRGYCICAECGEHFKGVRVKPTVTPQLLTPNAALPASSPPTPPERQSEGQQLLDELATACRHLGAINEHTDTQDEYNARWTRANRAYVAAKAMFAAGYPVSMAHLPAAPPTPEQTSNGTSPNWGGGKAAEELRARDYQRINDPRAASVQPSVTGGIEEMLRVLETSHPATVRYAAARSSLLRAFEELREERDTAKNVEAMLLDNLGARNERILELGEEKEAQRDAFAESIHEQEKQIIELEARLAGASRTEGK